MLLLAVGLLFAIGGTAGVATATPEDGEDGPPEASELVSIEVHVSACEPGYTGTDFYADCHSHGAPNVTVTLSSTDGNVSASSTTEVTAEDTPGIATFGELPPGEYVITIDIPGDVAAFESYCSADNGATAVPLAPEDSNQSTATFAAGQAVVCDWYAIPFDQGPPETPAPTEPSETPEPSKSAQISLEVRACNAGFDAEGAGSADFFAACPELIADVGFTLIAESGAERSARTDAGGAVTFADLTPGFYSLGSDVPGHDARASLFCSAYGVGIYEKDVNDSGFTTFADLESEQISCDWYIVPLDLRGDGDSSVTPTPTPAPTITTTTTKSDSNGESVTTLPRTGSGIRGVAAQNDLGWPASGVAFGLLGLASSRRARRTQAPQRPVRSGDPHPLRRT
jgi:hypothetical protein